MGPDDVEREALRDRWLDEVEPEPLDPQEYEDGYEPEWMRDESRPPLPAVR
jgi:hypothetical protein